MKRLALLAALLALWAPPAFASIGAVAQIANNGSGAVASFAVTTTADCPVGGTVVVFAQDHATTGTPAISATDSAGTPNTYTGFTQVSGGTAGVDQFRVLTAPVTTDLPSGQTVTVSVATSTAKFSVAVECVASGLTATPNDVQPSAQTGTQAINTGPTALTAVVTGTLGASSEVVFNWVIDAGNTSTADTLTQASGFSSLSNVVPGGNRLFVGYQIVSSNASVSIAPSLTTSNSASTRTWFNGTSTLKGTGGGVVAHNLGLLGVGQ